MNEQIVSILPIANYLRKLIVFFSFSFLFVSCNKVDKKSKVLNSVTTEISQPQKDKLANDTNKLQIEKHDSLKETTYKMVSKHQKVLTPQIRVSDQVSDAKFNGEKILLQEELTEKIFLVNPDTIKRFLKKQYLNQLRNFPRSIADNFEQGISTEHISYPKLNYRVELFKDIYSQKPYKILEYSARKEGEEIIVE